MFPRFISPFILIVVIFSSCVSRKKLIYIQDPPEKIELELLKYTPKLKPDDLLSINVGSLNIKATEPFNQGASQANLQDNDLNTYLIDESGNINFPVIGKVMLSGLTRKEATEKLESELSSYLKNPTVTIRIKNLKITVLGEVNMPGTYAIQGERITILEALGMAGDLKITGLRNNILVVREDQEEKLFYRLDLRDPQLFNSPVYYLSQNDVVYVEPNQLQIDSTSSVYRNVPFFVSLVSLMVVVITQLSR